MLNCKVHYKVYLDFETHFDTHFDTHSHALFHGSSIDKRAGYLRKMVQVISIIKQDTDIRCRSTIVV